MRVVFVSLLNLLALLLIISCGGGEADRDTASSGQPVSGDEPAAETEIPAETDGSSEQPVEMTEDTATQEETVTSDPAAGPAGTWNTTMGELAITVDDSGDLTGEYPLGTFQGRLEGNTLSFTYSEGSLSGEGEFVFSDDFDSFSGTQDVAGTDVVWEGSRSQ